MRRKTKRLPSTALGSLTLQWRRGWDSNPRYIAAHLLEATSLLHARAADLARANRLKRSAAGFAARQRDAPALGSGRGGEAQGALRAACGAESAGGAELRHEREHKVLPLDFRRERPVRTQAHAEAAGIAAAVEREVGVHGGGLSAMSECPGGSGERSEFWAHGVLPHSRCVRRQPPIRLCRCRARTLPSDSTARHTIGRPNIVRPCRRTLPAPPAAAPCPNFSFATSRKRRKKSRRLYSRAAGSASSKRSGARPAAARAASRAAASRARCAWTAGRQARQEPMSSCTSFCEAIAQRMPRVRKPRHGSMESGALFAHARRTLDASAATTAVSFAA